MILLRKLILKDFLSHENTEIDFAENEKALIDGASGAGKSSIFDAIIWCLYGVGRADNRSLVRKGTKKGSVSLELLRQGESGNPDETFYVTRTAAGNGKHTLEVAYQKGDGPKSAYPLSGVRELQAWIDKELIGASYLLFVNSVAYVQGNSESFVSQTAPKRKELLLEIVKAEDYEKYYEQARKKLSELENDRNKAAGQVIELESRLEALMPRLGARMGHIHAIAEATEHLKEVEPLITALEAQKASFMAISQTIGVLEDSLRMAEMHMQNAQTILDANKNKISEKDILLFKVEKTSEYKLEAEKVTAELTSLRRNLASVSEQEEKRNKHYANKPLVSDRTSEIKRYGEQLDFLEKKEICPAGEKCPYHSKTLESIKYNVDEVAKLLALTAEENLALARWSIEEGTLPPATDMSSLIKGIREAEDNLREQESQVANCDIAKRELKLIEEIEKDTPRFEKSLEEEKTRVEEIKKQKAEAELSANKDEMNRIANDLLSKRQDKDIYNANVTRAKTALEAIDRDEEEVKIMEARVASIRNVELAIINEKTRKVTLVKDAFGSKGIETLVIDYLLPKLEDRINEVLAKLSDFRVRLDTQKKSADGESTIEGLFITILNELNEEMPFEAYSGGEKLKISVSISEALATLQKVGFRLFDETFIGLDENSTESFAEILEGLQKNFGQVLCISHLLQIKSLFDKKININKTNNISHVKP